MTTRVLSAPRVLWGVDAKRERRNWLLPPLLLQEERRRLPRQAEEWRSIRVAPSGQAPKEERKLGSQCNPANSDVQRPIRNVRHT